MVAYFGMSEHLPNLSYYDSTGHSDYGFTKPYSEKTAELIDAEAKAIVGEQYLRAKEILLKNAEGHAQLSALLLEREVIFAEDLESVFGKRPWSSRHDELILQDDENDSIEPGATDVVPALNSPSTASTDKSTDTTSNIDKADDETKV